MGIEPQFLLCWIIWEHLFATLKRNDYTIEQLENDISSETKISYLIEEYFDFTLNSNSRKEIKRMKKARDKLVHHGTKPSNIDYEEMDLFIKATECLVCKILKLEPSNVFNTDEKLAKFLKIRT